MKVVYITGCLGFIGSYVTRECLNKGWHVKGIDKMTYAYQQDILPEFKKYKNFTFHKEDIVNLKWLYECDYIINTAAETHVDNSIVSSEDFIHSNIVGVHNLLELIRKRPKNMPILLHFSTDEVYGDITNGSHTEQELLKPSNPYSATKAAADQLVLAWGRTYKVPYMIVRPTNNYGIGQYVEKLIPRSCKLLNLNKKIELHDKGMPIRNWLHAKDTAQAIITIIENGNTNEIYNISGDLEQSNYETVKKILEIYFNKETLDYDKYLNLNVIRDGQDIRYCLDDSKLKKLGWSPKIKFDKELINIVKYYKERFIW